MYANHRRWFPALAGFLTKQWGGGLKRAIKDTKAIVKRVLSRKEAKPYTTFEMTLIRILFGMCITVAGIMGSRGDSRKRFRLYRKFIHRAYGPNSK